VDVDVRVLLVVHRFSYPGGSEMYISWIGKEFVKRGYETWVLTDEHKGDVDGIHVTSDYSVADQNFDAIIVHGGDCKTQNFIHSRKFKSPVLYLIIYPSESNICLTGLSNAKYLGYSTTADYDYLVKHGYYENVKMVRHGVDTTIFDDYEPNYFSIKHGLPDKRYVLSVGGFWSHKGFNELAEVFNDVRPKNLVLCLCGYAKPELAPRESEWVRVFYGLSDKEIRCALCDASLYVMNSRDEGFGLVLLESMLFGVPWAARPVGGAVLPDMSSRGCVYDNRVQLSSIISELDRGEFEYPSIVGNIKYIKRERSIANTVDDIEKAMGWRGK
jgi:glycosyltransferase involved in cell wall biosynthesis